VKRDWKKKFYSNLDSHWKALFCVPDELLLIAELRKDLFPIFLPSEATESEWGLLYKRKEINLFSS
jgi:hypothetical protein